MDLIQVPILFSTVMPIYLQLGRRTGVDVIVLDRSSHVL